MPRILIVKTSSMGDVVHNLPVVSDLRRAMPEARIDWVVEEAYAGLVALHHGVDQVLPVALRRWRRDWLGAVVRAERGAFRAALRAHAYDAVLDTQGLLKSALIARQARLAPGGARIGFDRYCAREPLACLFYQRRYGVDLRLHAVERLRSLSAQAFAYTVEGLPDFGLGSVGGARFDWLGATSPESGAGFETRPGYVVLLHATSRPEKNWPVAHWIELGGLLAQAGLASVLPSGNASERVHAGHIAAGIADRIAALQIADGAALAPIVAPPIVLADAAHLLAGARAVIGVDTGLTHLAAALDVPTVALFGATARWRFGPYWTARAVSLGDAGIQPDVEAVHAALRGLGVTP